jgi:hypothetical protein
MTHQYTGLLKTLISDPCECRVITHNPESNPTSPDIGHGSSNELACDSMVLLTELKDDCVPRKGRYVGRIESKDPAPPTITLWLVRMEQRTTGGTELTVDETAGGKKRG